MGGSLSKIFGSKKKEMRMLMLGLDNAGKTTILNRLKFGESGETVPTVGFNIQSIKYKNIIMHTWDIGGQQRIRALWRHYFSGTDALIFVIDSSDKERLSQAKNEMFKVINDKELKNCLVAILANKQDIEGAIKPKEVIEFLGLDSVVDHNWCVIPTVAINGTGLNEVLSWITTHSNSK